jgi:hypothetical protein
MVESPTGVIGMVWSFVKEISGLGRAGEVYDVVEFIAEVENECPQSQTTRRAEICRRHWGQALVHSCLERGRFATGFALLSAARDLASVLAAAHCGWMPLKEYEGFLQNGHIALAMLGIIGVGLRSLTKRPPPGK